MPSKHIPTEDGERPAQSKFDAMCSEVQEFEHLPVVKPAPAAPGADLTVQERTALDAAILAALVSP